MTPTPDRSDPRQRLAQSREQLRALRDTVAPDASGFPRSATMKVLTSGHIVWRSGLLLVALLARRPRAVAQLLRFLPVRGAVTILAGKLLSRYAARASR